MSTVTLVSNDDRTFVVDAKVARLSGLVRGLASGNGDEPCRLAAVDGATLVRVLDFCKRHANNPLPEIPKRLPSTRLEDVLPPWDASFIRELSKNDDAPLFALLEAAAYMDIPDLLRVTAAAVAVAIHACSEVADLRARFGVVPSAFTFTSEQEAKDAEEESAWLRQKRWVPPSERVTVPDPLHRAPAQFLACLHLVAEAGFSEQASRCVNLCSATRADAALAGGVSNAVTWYNAMGRGTFLMAAARMGATQRVRWWLDRGADPTVTDGSGWTAWHHAVAHHRDAASNLLLEHIMDVNVPYDGWPALHFACAYGRDAVVLQLLQRGANANAVDQDAYTPLHRACEYPTDAAVCRMWGHLLDHGADINARAPSKSKTLLHAAATLRSDSSRLKLLVARGADLEARDEDGCTPLHRACDRYCEENAMYLLDSGANPRAHTDKGGTVLMYAAARKLPHVVRRLLQMGVDPNDAADARAWTALHYVCLRGDRDMAKMLLEAGADVNAKRGDLDYDDDDDDNDNHDDKGEGSKGHTPLSVAFQTSIGEPLVLELLDRGASVTDVVGYESQTPLQMAISAGWMAAAKKMVEHGATVTGAAGGSLLHTAILKGDTRSASFLLEHGAPVDWAPADTGETALALVCRCAKYYTGRSTNYTDVAALLLAAGADVTHKDARGNTPLHYACESGMLAVVAHALDHGVSVHLKAGDGDSLLHRACQGNAAAVVAALLDHGAEVNATRPGGLTPLHVAALRSHTQLIPLLLRRGADASCVDRNGRTAAQILRANGQWSSSVSVHLQQQRWWWHSAVAVAVLLLAVAVWYAEARG